MEMLEVSWQARQSYQEGSCGNLRDTSCCVQVHNEAQSNSMKTSMNIAREMKQTGNNYISLILMKRYCCCCNLKLTNKVSRNTCM